MQKPVNPASLQVRHSWSHFSLSPSLGGLKVGASVAYEHAFEVSQLKNQSKKLQLPFRNTVTHFRIRSLTNLARLGQISPDSQPHAGYLIAQPPGCPG